MQYNIEHSCLQAISYGLLLVHPDMLHSFEICGGYNLGQNGLKKRDKYLSSAACKQCTIQGAADGQVQDSMGRNPSAHE